jgi:SAM-dependent methyltransferase
MEHQGTKAAFERRPVDEACLSCGSRSMTAFYSVDRVPVQSLKLCLTEQRARLYPQGRVQLAFCERCGFIANIDFDPQLLASDFQETWTFPPAFNPFADRLVDQLIGPLNIRGKRVLDIGCGTGRFLTLLCRRGGNTGIGFDRSYVPDGTEEAVPGVEFVREDYGEVHAGHAADVIVCRMALSHFQNPLRLLRDIRKSIGDRQGVLVLFQVPNMKRILRKAAFWDICYEHCSYFTTIALAGILNRLGFLVRTSWTDENQQHLFLLAEGANGAPGQWLSEGQLRIMLEDTERFAQQCEMELRFWRTLLREARDKGQRAVLWGGSAKGVSFLSTIELGREIDFVVDIDPGKENMYIPGSGHRVVGPAQLRHLPPDLVLVMNEAYIEEIRTDLAKMNIHPVLRVVE